MEKNNMKPVDKWRKWAKRFGLTGLFVIAVVIIMAIAGIHLEDYVWMGLLVMSAVSMLGFLFSEVALFIAKLRTPKDNSGNLPEPEKVRPVGWRTHKKLIFAGGAILLLFILFLFGFLFGSSPETCKDVECFIAAAKDGNPANFQSTDETNMEWNYQIEREFSGNLIFTKTLLRLDDKELPQIKEFLEGKSLTCKLQDAFDERLVTSLFYGIGNNCSGELKENLGQLLFLL